MCKCADKSVRQRGRRAIVAAALFFGSMAGAGSALSQLLPPPEPPKGPQPYELVHKPGPLTQAEMRKWVVGKTWLSHSGGHGTQVTYIDPGGRAHLWRSGNRMILPSRWYFRDTVDSYLYRHPGGAGQSIHKLPTAALCFDYGTNTFNPVTRSTSGQECGTPNSWQRLHFDSVAGDPLGLARMKSPPFVLDRERTTFTELLERLRKGRS